jgi:conjugal transfer pilus assembly protein TraU
MKVLLIAIVLSAKLANASCVGKILNPISDICWGCIFPISLGGMTLMKGRFKDTRNPKFPVCFCYRGVPMVPGIAIGFWEPIRVIEITRTPFCLVSLGGVKVANSKNHGGFRKVRTESDKRSKSYYHIHYYVYPLISLLNLMSDLGCVDTSSYDLAYISEVDPAHLNDKIANLLHPETFLLSTPVAKAACSVECIKTSATRLPTDMLFWCSGCQGSLYPFSGSVEGHVGGANTSSLMATRQIAKLHRLGLARKTATHLSKAHGELCKSSYAYRIPKSQYRLQMTYPVANTKGPYACNTLGMSDTFWSSGREFPYKGEDFVYMLWRKRNCCLL